MSDLICRKSMMRCQTPGMCSPHGGCQPSALIETNVRYSASSGAAVTDYTGLKRLAEAATPGPWVVSYSTQTRGTRINAIRKGGQSLVGLARSDKRDPNHVGAQKANSEFMAAANPAAILALISENENYRSRQDRYEAVCEDRRNEICDLKSEVEALRKHVPSAEIIWCACGDGYPANSYGAGFMDANNGVCENCDAANSVRCKSSDLSTDGHGDSADLSTNSLRKDAGRYRHLKSSWDHGSLIERLECNVLPKDWDATIDAAMSKEAGHD